MIIHCNYDKLVSIDRLRPHPKNRNDHPDDQVKRLAEILKYQGWRYPVKVSNLSGFIISGHGRVAAAQENGWEEVPVNFQDYESEEQEYADVQSDNAIASWAELDLKAISVDLADLGPDFDIDMLGIRDFTLEPADKYNDQDEDSVPEHVEPKTKLGDLYRLGDHRLLCGDATMIDAVDKLMGVDKADMVFTDPPYGINLIKGERGKVGGGTKKYPTKEFGAIIGDDEAFDPRFLLGYSEKIIMWGGNYFASALDDSRCWFIWDKNHVTDRTFCGTELAWTNLDMHSKIFKSTWDGYTKEGESGSKIHPSQKPIKLCADILDHVDVAIILDPFGGSGSTLIACEKTNRKCFMMELDPKYCDVIVKRWEDYTGQEAELING